MSDPELDFVMVGAMDADPWDSPGNPPRKLADLRGWLQPTLYLNDSSDFKKHLNAHVQGTGRWLLDSPGYQQWRNSTTQGALWLEAVAGTGKSVLAAHLISELQTQQDQTPLLFFFFRRIVTANHGCQSLVRDWLHQLLDFSPDLREKLEIVKEQNPDVEHVAFSVLWQSLLVALETVEKVYCVVDALDELDTDQADGFLPRLVALGQMRPDAVKLIMTSRPLPQIQKYLNHPAVLQVRLEDRQVNQDIALFVEHRLLQAPELSLSVKDKIKRLIEDRVHPSFLYARLTLNDLLKKERAESLGVDMVQDALRSLPASLEDMYTHMLFAHSQLASVPPERQVLILQLATHASRPLRLLEISTVLNFLDMNEGKTEHGDTKNMTRMSCGPLLEILQDETVSVIHHSFTEFLTDTRRKDRMLDPEASPTFPIIKSSETHELMALICVRYLLSGCLSSWTPKPREERHKRAASAAVEQKERQLRHPFLAYALENWAFHTRRSPEINGQLLDVLDQLMRPKTNTFLCCADYMMQPHYDVESITPLHVAAWGGLTDYMETRLMSCPNLNVMSENDETPLAMAAQRGHSDTVSLLLKHGAAPNIPDKRGMKPLHYAAKSNHHATVQVLVDAGVSPITGRTKDYWCSVYYDASISMGETPLQYASEFGCVEAIAAMVPYLSQENLKYSLIRAIRRSHVSVVQYLLETGLLDIESNFGGEALIEAGSELNFEILQLLLRNGADPMYQQQPLSDAHVCIIGNEPRTERSSLVLAICGSDHSNSDNRLQMLQQCLDLALSVGCDVNVHGEGGKTALHYCIMREIPVVERLLKYGARADDRDLQGDVPLHLLRLSPAAEETVEALIRYGARWNAVRDRDGKTALHTCLENSSGNIEWMKPYVEDWNVRDRDGNTPLHIVEKSDKSLIQQLVGIGADINSKNYQGETALHKISCGTYDIREGGRALLAVGADIEARDNNGRTWFLRAVMEVHFSMEPIEMILELGADRHAADYEGNNALHLVCEHSRKSDMLMFLLDVGLDPLHRNHMGNTLYHAVADYPFRTFFDPIKDTLNVVQNTAIQLQTRNYKGETLLHLVCSKHCNPAIVDDLPSVDIEAMLKMADNQGKTPLHNAVSNCEGMAEWAISRASDLTVRTHQGLNLLHMAAEVKKSNVIGLLLESYPEDQKTAALNQADRDGRTPLHYACRSGRPESVQLLLEAGADIRTVDKNGYTPLHSCALFERRSNILYDDIFPSTHDKSDDKTLRVSDIVHLLCRYGADLLSETRFRKTPIQLAIDSNNEEMVCELTREMEESFVGLPSLVDFYRDSPGQLYLSNRQMCTDTLVKELSRTKDSKRIFTLLICSAAYRTLEGLAGRGTVYTSESVNWRRFLIHLARMGYSDLLGRLLKKEKNVDWINESLLLHESWPKAEHPMLFFVAARELPSLFLLKLLVENFKADVNVRSSATGWLSEPSVLHILAQGKHWWQTEACRYVLSQGADVTERDEHGCTPLHIAMIAQPRRIDIVKALLEHGADPNATDNNGDTPFSSTTGDHGLFRLFLQYGADLTTGNEPMLFRAIQNLDAELVQVILQAGVGSNVPFKRPPPHPQVPKVHQNRMDRGAAEKNYSLWLPPIWVAARMHFEKPDELHKHKQVVRIVEVLLEHGASPYESLEDTTILHALIDYGGTLGPLLSLPKLELEQRDNKGRTLLLAACGGEDPDEVPFNRCLGSYRIGLIRQLCAMGANVTAIDSKGQNVLHLLVIAMKDPEDQIELMSLIKDLVIRRPELLAECNEEGYTPLLLAAAKKRVPTTAALVDAGANILERDHRGNTLLHHLASHLCSLSGEDSFYAHRLMGLALNFNARNYDGDTPLSKYILSFNDQPEKLFGDCYVDQLKGFQQYGADFHTVNTAGETLLHLAARIPWHDDTDANGFSFAMFLSGNHGDYSVAAFKCLMGMGLDPFQEDYDQRTPLDVAAAYGKDEIVGLFQKK